VTGVDLIARLWERLDIAEDLPPDPTATVASFCGSDRVMRWVLLGALLEARGAASEGLLAESLTLAELATLVLDDAVGSYQPIEAPVLPEWPVRSNRLFLRPLLPADCDRAYDLVNDPSTGFRMATRGRTMTAADLALGMQRDSFLCLVAARSDTFRPVGAYTLAWQSEHDQRAELAVFGFGSSGSHLRGEAPFAGLEGLAMFLSHAFRSFNLRKVMAGVPGWNWPQFASGTDRYFTVEGVHREHDFFDGRWWDRYLLAITRGGWQEVEPGIVRSLAALLVP
jgi:RimJ/RimL family protein N-acetyltransferase